MVAEDSPASKCSVSVGVIAAYESDPEDMATVSHHILRVLYIFDRVWRVRSVKLLSVDQTLVGTNEEVEVVDETLEGCLGEEFFEFVAGAVGKLQHGYCLYISVCTVF